jgi:hypothetical protein
VQPKNIGRRLKCKVCSAGLYVAEDGLRLDDSATGESEPLSELAESAALAGGRSRLIRGSRRSSQGGGFSLAEWWRWNLQLSTPMFGAGVTLILVFLFLPLIDNAVLLSKQADLRAGELREQRLAEQYARNKQQNKTTPADEEMRNKNRENWERERRDLELIINETRLAHDKWEYWYRWGMLLGFVLLALGALGFLQPDEPLTKRIVGAIVLVAMVLMVFILFLGMRGLRG